MQVMGYDVFAAKMLPGGKLTLAFIPLAPTLIVTEVPQVIRAAQDITAIAAFAEHCTWAPLLAAEPEEAVSPP